MARASVSGMDWERSKEQKYAEKYWMENGYSFVMKRAYISKSVYIVSKDGVEMKFELPYTVSDIKLYMKLFEQSFELHKRCLELEAKNENSKNTKG